MRRENPAAPRRRDAFSPPSAALLISLALAAFVTPAAGQSNVRPARVELRSPIPEVRACMEFPRANIDGENFCLRGKVKTITTEARTLRTQAGRVAEGDIYSIVINELDERGNRTLLAISDRFPGPVGQVYRRLVFSFDAGGRPAGWKAYMDGDPRPAEVMDYSYDESGNRIREEFTRAETNQNTFAEFSYDAQGRKVEESRGHLSSGGWVTGRAVNTFDGNQVHSVAYSAAGAPTAGGTFVNNDRGDPLEEEQYKVNAQGGRSLWRKVSYRYDRRGLLVETIYHKADPANGSRATFEYDERGNLTSATRYGGDGTFAVSEHFEHEYDSHGNWVKRVTSNRASEKEAPAPYRVERRTIRYH